MGWLGTAATIVALVSGIGGLAFSTYNFVDRRREKQRRIVVTLEDNGFIFGGTLASGERIPVVVVTAENHGFREVELKEAGVFLPNRHKLTVVVPVFGTQFPHVLRSGDSCPFFMDAKNLAEAVNKSGYGEGVRIHGYYRDGLGTFYRSKPIAFNPNDFLK